MNYYIDCEFDGFGGPLLSMGIVTMYGHQFYEVLKYDKINDPWVEKNVVPHLNKRGIADELFRDKLVDFILTTAYDSKEVKVVADWPDDLRYFFQYITSGPGMINMKLRQMNITSQLVFGVRYTSTIPHNALQDALAIMRALNPY